MVNGQLNGPNSPPQQLGAVPGTAGASAVLGYTGNEPEELDGAEFASSGNAENAQRDDYDNELPDDVLEAARLADLLSREAANLDYVGMNGMSGMSGMDYDESFL